MGWNSFARSANSPAKDRTYVILITGKELDGQRADIFAGVDDLITKPFDWGDFERRLRLVEEQILRIRREPEMVDVPSLRPDLSHLSRLSPGIAPGPAPLSPF